MSQEFSEGDNEETGESGNRYYYCFCELSLRRLETCRLALASCVKVLAFILALT